MLGIPPNHLHVMMARLNKRRYLAEKLGLDQGDDVEPFMSTFIDMDHMKEIRSMNARIRKNITNSQDALPKLRTRIEVSNLDSDYETCKIGHSYIKGEKQVLKNLKDRLNNSTGSNLSKSNGAVPMVENSIEKDEEEKYMDMKDLSSDHSFDDKKVSEQIEGPEAEKPVSKSL